jgi:hypothetical protein
MTLPRKGNHNFLEMLYNRKDKQAQSIVENVYGILKKIFHEFQGKIEMHINLLQIISLVVLVA